MLMLVHPDGNQGKKQGNTQTSYQQGQEKYYISSIWNTIAILEFPRKIACGSGLCYHNLNRILVTINVLLGFRIFLEFPCEKHVVQASPAIGSGLSWA